MRKYIIKIKVFYSDLVNVSKLTKTKNKKLKIIFLAMTINIMVALDIIIILFFSNFFSDEISFTNSILEYILSYEKLLPIYILFRFFLIYLEKIITTNLQIDIENNFKPIFGIKRSLADKKQFWSIGDWKINTIIRWKEGRGRG